MKKIDVVIIGTGPAGLFAGVQIQHKSTVLLEKKKKSSLKLLISGGGQCNFTHTGTVKEFTDVFNGHKAFLKISFKQFFNEDTMAYFASKGIGLVKRPDGKVFPKSLSAQDIKNALVQHNKDLGHKIVLGETVKKVVQTSNGFQVITDQNIYLSTYVVAAFGGCSYPSTGSDGQLFKVIKGLGHTIESLKPSLAPIYTEKVALCDLQGISFYNARITHYRDKDSLGAYSGDLLITHFGLSGPLVLNNSRYFMAGDCLAIQFGQMDRKALEDYIIHQSSKEGKRLIGTVLTELDYPKRLVEFLLGQIGIAKATKLSDLSKERRKKLSQAFCHYSVDIHHIGGFNVAMATTGGIAVDEINRKTMMSKIVPNLFFAGECVDIDGNTGGYNIQWAMTSGYIAGKAVHQLLSSKEQADS